MKRRKLMFITILLISLFLGACSNSQKDSDIVTLKLWNRYPELNSTFEDFVRGFEEENPGIKVELQNIPSSSQAAQYQTAISEKNLPDIFTTTSAVTLQELVDMDMAKDLNEYFTQDKRDEFHPGTWYENGTTIDDTAYVLPLFGPSHGVYMMYYNKDVLEENGISEDELPKTWDEFIQIGERIYESSNEETYGLIWYNKGWTNADFINSQSTAIFPETPWDINYKEGTPDYINTGKVETIKFLKTLQDKNIMHPISMEIDPPKAEANFAAGKAAFMIAGNYRGSNLIESSDFENWDVVNMPTKDGKPWYYMASRETNGLVVNKETEHWDEVKDFIEYALENIYSDVVMKSGTTQPAKIDVDGESPFPQYEKISKLMTDQTITVPKPSNQSLDTVEFEREYTSHLSFSDIGEVAVGYLSGEVQDLDSELEKINEEANEAFNDLLEKHTEVKREFYQFPDWEPFNPYGN